MEQAIGELVTCSRCVGTWVAAGLATTQVLAPRFGRHAHLDARRRPASTISCRRDSPRSTEKANELEARGLARARAALASATTPKISAEVAAVHTNRSVFTRRDDRPAVTSRQSRTDQGRMVGGPATGTYGAVLVRCLARRRREPGPAVRIQRPSAAERSFTERPDVPAKQIRSKLAPAHVSRRALRGPGLPSGAATRSERSRREVMRSFVRLQIRAAPCDRSQGPRTATTPSTSPVARAAFVVLDEADSCDRASSRSQNPPRGSWSFDRPRNRSYVRSRNSRHPSDTARLSVGLVATIGTVDRTRLR